MPRILLFRFHRARISAQATGHLVTQIYGEIVTVWSLGQGNMTHG